jgi:hypothetical protein
MRLGRLPGHNLSGAVNTHPNKRGTKEGGADARMHVLFAIPLRTVEFNSIPFDYSPFVHGLFLRTRQQPPKRDHGVYGDTAVPKPDGLRSRA